MRRHKIMVFCKVSMAIPLFTSLLSSRMLRCIQTLFIDVSNTELSSNESGWLLHDSTSGDTCFITVAPNSVFSSDMIAQTLNFSYNALVYFLHVLQYLKSDLSRKFQCSIVGFSAVLKQHYIRWFSNHNYLYNFIIEIDDDNANQKPLCLVPLKSYQLKVRHNTQVDKRNHEIAPVVLVGSL